MSRPGLLVVLACGVLGGGCNTIAAVAGAPKIVSVTINAPAGLLVGESAIATAVAMGDDGRDHGGRPRHWSSSDPAALSIDDGGKMTALIAGRTVTITCEVDGTKGTATIVIATDDTRFGYALADPGVKSKLESLGNVTMDMSQKEFAKLVREETDSNKRLLAAAGVKPQ
jgi:hypothetical protein